VGSDGNPFDSPDSPERNPLHADWRAACKEDDRVKKVMQQQKREDRQLDQLSGVLDSLLDQSQEIGKMLEQSNRKLDDIDVHVDQVDARVQHNTRTARRIR